MPINEFEALENATKKAQEKMSSLGVSTALDKEMEEVNRKANIQKAFNAIKLLNSNNMEDMYNILQKNEKIDKELQAAQDLKEKRMESLLLDNVTEFSDFNRDKSTHIADYSLSAKWKDMGLRLASGIPQGLGLVGDYVANHMNSTGKYLFSDTDKSYDEIFAKEQAKNNGFSKFANWVTSPLDEARAKINSQSLIGYDQLMDSYENEGLLDNLALTGSFALDLAPSLLETAIMAVPGVGTAKGLAAIGATYLAETNKEEQGKKVGKTSNQVQGVENNTDILDIIGAAGQAAFAVPELLMLKHAAGVAKSPTKSIFDAINKTKAKQSVDEFVDNYALAPGRWLYKGAGLAARPTAALGYMAAMEAISETGQEASKKIANEDWWNKSTAENMNDLKESAVLGAIGGASLGGGIRAVTAPIEYVGNKAKEAEIFETTKERAKNISETLDIEDKFSSSIKEVTDSKGNVKKTREVKNPMDSLPQKQKEAINNAFYNLSQVSLKTYDSDPNNSHKKSLLNVDNDTDVLKQIFSYAAAGFLSPIQKDGKELYSQNIIEESLSRAKQAVREHINSIIESNPDTTTDGVITTLAAFKEKMKDNSALDFYVARQMLTNPKEVAAILAEVANKNQAPTNTKSDTSVQNESEGQSLNSYENGLNSSTFDTAAKQGLKEAEQQGKATKAYTKEQLNNIKKAAKFISELTGIEELAANADQILNDNSNSNTTPKNRASSAVSSMLNRINSIITALETPEDTREDFKTNAELNTKLGTILTGHTTFTGQRKEGLATILQNALATINEAEGKRKQKNKDTIKDIKSLKWWLNSHRAKYKMYKKIVKDLKEAEENGRKPQEAIYMVQKDITPNGIGDVINIKGRENIAEYLKENFKNSNSELDEELSKVIKDLENNKNTNLIDIMKDLRNYINNKGSGYHIFTITPNNKSETTEKTLEDIAQEGKAITETLEILEDSTMPEEELNGIIQKVNESTNPSEEVGINDSNENNTKEETKANKETKQDNSTNIDNTNENTPPFDPDPKPSEVKNETKSEQTNTTQSFNNSNKSTPVNDIISNTNLNSYGSVKAAFNKLREIYKGKTQGEAVEKMSEALGKYKIGRDFLKALLDMKVVHGNSPKSVEAIQNTLNKYKNQENSQQESKSDTESTPKNENIANSSQNNKATDKNTSTNNTDNNQENKNTQVPKQENSRKVENEAKGISKKTTTNNPIDTTIENFIDEDILESLNADINQNMEQSVVDRIIRTAKDILKSVVTKMSDKVNKIRDNTKDNIKKEDIQKEARNRLLNLEKILKPKDNPKSILNVLNQEDFKNIVSRINSALQKSFGLKEEINKEKNIFKETINFSKFNTFFAGLGSANFLMSKDLNNKNIDNTSAFFSDNKVILSATIRALEVLTDSRFSYSDFKDLKEKYPNLKNRREIFSVDLDYLLRGVPLADIANDIGKKILSDIGLEINEKNTTLGDADRIYQELGIAAIMSLESLELVNIMDIKYSDIYNNMKNENASEKRVKLNLNNVYTKEGSGNLSTAISFITDLQKELNLDKNDYVNTYSTKPFSVREFVKTKQGPFALTKKMYKAINAFLNTPFVVENYTDVKGFIDEHEGELKSFLGYIDLSKYIDNDRKLIEGKTPTELYTKTGIKYSDIDSVLGKNLQIENSINHLKDLLNNESAAKEGIYFNKVFASGRLWLQSSTVNPQSNKLHRFLVTLKTQTKKEKIENGNLSNSTYVAIAQAFGYKTDKKTEAINVGKAIVETNGLREKVIEALGNKGEIELGNGTKLEIEEIGHALNALFNIEKFLNEKKNNPNLTKFKHNIVEEVDGINNGIALKGLTFFVSPKIFDTLLSTGISCFGELEDSVMPDKFSAKASENGKANPDKAWDTYEQFAIVTSKGFKKTTDILSKPVDIDLVNLKMKKDDGVELTQEQEKILVDNQNILDVDYDFVNMASRFGVGTSKNNKSKLTALRENVKNFGEAMSGINNLMFVKGDPDTVESVSKEARKLNKYIVIPASYGSGLTANIRSLTTFVVDNFGDWILKKEQDKNFENSPEWGIVKSILDSLSLLNPNISYIDYKGDKQELTIDSLKDIDSLKAFVLNNADGIGAAKVSIDSNIMTLYEFIDSHMKVVTKQGVKDSRDNILPGYESVNNSINSVHNLFQIILTNKYNMKAMEVLKNSGRLDDVNIEKNPFYTHLLTIEEHKQILSELRNDFPSITVDSKERFGEDKEKRYVGRISMANLDRVTTPTNDINIYYPGVSIKETADRNSKWINISKAFSMAHHFKSVLFSSVGATPTAIMTQQKDGTDMIEAMIESADKNGGQLDINDIFDAILRHSSDGSSNNSLISIYNRRQVNEALNSSQLYEQTRLAAKAARDMSEVDENTLNTLVQNGTYNGVNITLSNGNSTISIKDTLVGYTKALAHIMHMKYKISEVNKAIVRNLKTVASNMQNGHESDKATIKPEIKDLLKLVSSSIINDPYAEQDPKEFIKNNLMIDITSPEIANELSRIEELLNAIYDNRIPKNDKKINSEIITNINEGIKNLNSIINNKIKSIQGKLKNIGANEVSKNLLRYIKPLGKGALSLEAKRENGRDIYQDNDESKVSSDNEIKEEEIKEVEENNSSSSNSPAENKDTKEVNTKPTKESKPKENSVETIEEKSVIERLTEALEKILEPNSKKDRAIEAINQDKAKENTPDRVEKAKNKINDILKVGFNKKINLNQLGKNKEGFVKLKEAFQNKLENFNVDEYLQDKTKYIEELFKDIAGKDSIFDKINKEVLKSFENVDDTTVSDTSMDEFVSQIDLSVDKVSTTQEQMRSIDESNGRAMSKEFSNHLKGVLSELSSLASEAVNGVKVKYFKSKGKGHNEGEYLTQLREILIKEGIPLNKANYTGVASLEETYSHELLHAITYYVIKAQRGSNPLTRELSMLHKRYLSVMTPNKLAKFINSGIESKDLEVANRIMSHFESNTIEGLAEFIAIALSNEAVWSSLKDIEVKNEPNYDGMTFGERVVAKAMNMFNTFFNSIYRKYQDSDSMQKAMLALATKIATANSKAEYKIDKENDLDILESADTLTTISRGLASGLDKLDEIGSKKLNKLKEYVKSSGVKLVSVPKSKRRKYNSRWEEIRGLVAILASDVTGDKVAQAALSVAHDIGLHYNGITQYIVSELSQMSDMKRKAEYFSRKRELLDANRAREIRIHAEELEEYFNTPLTLAENQALGEGMLDTDLSSLLDYYSIDELPDILNNTQSYKEKAYSDMLKEVDKNFKEKVGKYHKDDYKRYITNQANSLAYFMNFQSYRNEIEGAIGVKNPTMIAMMVGTGANIKPNKNIVSAIDKYVTLAALEYLESDVKELIINKLQTEPQGMEAMINYHRTNKAESLAKNFGGNPALMIKGYRYDVVEDYIDIKIAPISEEGLLKSQGFRRVSKEPLRKSPDDNSEARYIYVNDFVSSTASFNQQAVSYLGHTGRGSKLSDIYNDKILKGADVHTVEQEWYDSIVELTKNSSLAARKLMSPNYSPANFKDKNSSENTMVPIFDENGNLRDFAYLMSKKTKKDLLGLDTSLTKSLSHMYARMIDKHEAQALNKVVADTLFEDYDNANEAERKYHFVEMSFDSKDPYIKEIYKMLEPSFKNYLEEKFGGKIMVRASTMLNFFGQRDMDYRNTANYRDKDVPYKKLLLGSMDAARQLAKLSKMEIVLRFGSTIYNNVISNSITLLIRGVPMTQIVKDQIEGGRLLNKYLKDTKELKKLEAKKKAGGDVRDVEIENLIRELDRNPIKDMMDFGLFTTIQTFEDINLEDKDNSYTARQVRKYTVENENLSEGVRELMQKGYDWAFVTDRTVIGRGLTKFVQMGDFVARYALFKHYMRDGKMDKKEALEKVSDEFINYDLPVNKVIKFANDYGFLFFTRYAIVSQKVMAMLASDRPVSASTVVGLQAMFNIDFADIFDGNFFTKNLGELVSDPFTNLYRVLSPTGYDMIKGAYNRI
ncbi:hypothetical protein [Campylobacter devanensis]|uniref:hypothetical protein n=1 Tax=Campylobacter devanensis TaxID=3161138 RepID=UPI000A34045B|nr:hypothetical protein [Campylobacter sp. P0107]